MFFPLIQGGQKRRHFPFVFSAIALIAGFGSALAQEDVAEGEDQIEEITVTGSQIKGANISDALAVSVFNAEDIEMFGIESGEELIALIPENGQNYFNEADTAGGVNAARGDVGAFNLRNMGTGNTLVLLNGRRLVNAATYQTEEIGGSFVPVNSVNSNHIPVFGVDRLEILRDGASAIYGADAVAGVVNTVLKNDFEGLTLRLKQAEYSNLPRDDQAIALEWGKSLNGGRSKVGVFARYSQHDRVNAQDDVRWADSDFRRLVDPSSPLATNTLWRNDSANSLYGQFDVVSSVGSTNSLRVNDVVDNLGEFEVYPIGDPNCAGGFDTGQGTCIHEDGQGTVRYNLNELRDLASDMDRTTIYAYFNHDMDETTEFFSDFYYYQSNTTRALAPSTTLTAVPLRVGAANFYNPLGPCTSPNRLDVSIIGTSPSCNGLDLRIDNYRFLDSPRVIDVDGDAFRVLAGFRGEAKSWDWETAFVYSEATRDDIAHNRLSNTLLVEALFDPTPAAYNPFSGGVNSNIERAQIDVFRKGETSLGTWDLKFTNSDLFEMPAGPAGLLLGTEIRREDFKDDRDPRLDGTIDFIDFEGEGYPLTSDVVGSSPTPDGAGKRVTTSIFGELQLPIFETLDVQLAARYEDFSDVGDTTVGKIAAGWRPFEQVLVRGSWSTAFRAPNLITINEAFIARSNTLNDWTCFYGVDEGTVPSNNSFPGDCRYSIQRQASGSKSLVAEESTNTSIGLVVEPVPGLTFTFDYWSIEKDDSIGLFGEENHLLVDLVARLAAGISDCSNVVGNPAVVRDSDISGLSQVELDGFLAAGLCPMGTALFVSDQYANLDTRTIEGHDIGIYYDVETSAGDFSFRYNGSFYDKYQQDATSGISADLAAAKAADPTIIYPTAGLGNLLLKNGNQDKRQSGSISWRRSDYGASLSMFHIGEFFQELSNGDNWHVPAMMTLSATFDYSFEIADTDTRVRVGVNNLSDERAPLFDGSFGYSADAHNDLGRSYYVDVLMRF